MDELLDRVVPPFDAPGDWNDVLARARRQRRPRVRLLVIAAAALAVLVVAPALAVVFHDRGVHLPSEADRSNVVVILQPKTGRVLLEAAPWKGHDGFCYLVLQVRAGCVPRKSRGIVLLTPPVFGWSFDPRIRSGDRDDSQRQEHSADRATFRWERRRDVLPHPGPPATTPPRGRAARRAATRCRTDVAQSLRTASNSSCSRAFVETNWPRDLADPAAGLEHDRLERCVVPERERRVDAGLERALGDEHVLPEIAEPTRMPDKRLEPREVVRRTCTRRSRRRASQPTRRRSASRSRTRPRRAQPTNGARAPVQMRRRSTICPSRSSAISVAHTGIPREKFRVPSIGSTIQRTGPPSSPSSSPSTLSPGRSRAIRSRSRRSVARSASVTGVRSGFVSTRRSVARNRGSVSASAASASSSA